MAAKNITQAILDGYNAYMHDDNPNSPLSQVFVLNELKDFLAHEVMRLQNRLRREPTATELFEQVFNKEKS